MVYRRRIRPRHGRRKRWYFKAGANLPIIGKTNIALGTSKAKRSMYAIAKKVVRSNLEPKRNIGKIDNFAPLNAGIYTFNPMELILKGTDDVNRIGERIFLKNMQVGFSILNVQDQVNADYGHQKDIRIMLIKSKDNLTTGGTWASGFGSTTLFQQSLIGYNMITPINKERVSVLFDRKYKITDGDTAKKATTKWIKFNIPLDQSFQFDDQGSSVYSKWGNLYLVFVIMANGLASAAALPGTSMNMEYHINFADSK